MPTPPELVQGYSREPDGRWEQVRRYGPVPPRAVGALRRKQLRGTVVGCRCS